MEKIIPYNMVCRRLPGFKPSIAAAVSRNIKRNNGSGFAVIHPLYWKTHRLKSDALRQKYDAFEQTSSSAYASYLKRLEHRVSKESVVFLFAYNEQLALKWALGSKAPGPFILIRTGQTPIPSLPKYMNEKDKWEILAVTLKALGVKRFYVTGEENLRAWGSAGTYGKVTEKYVGCVNIAFKNLKDLLYVNTIDSLTFPGNNVHIEPSRIVMSEW